MTSTRPRIRLNLRDDPASDAMLPHTKRYRGLRRQHLKRTPTPTGLRIALDCADEMCEELLTRIDLMEDTLREFGLMHPSAPLVPTPASDWLTEDSTPTRDPGGTP